MFIFVTLLNLLFLGFHQCPRLVSQGTIQILRISRGVKRLQFSALKLYAYSRVHISLDEVFSKILKEPYCRNR